MWHDCKRNNGDYDMNIVECCTTSIGNGMALGTLNLLLKIKSIQIKYVKVVVNL